MFDEVVLDGEFFDGLLRVDAEIAELVRLGRCPRCSGALHRGDYGRKPRGGVLAVAGESQTRRFSFCCGREGCRRRATPPSLRFLGRRVYLEAVVIVASIVAMARPRAQDVRRLTAVPPRTVRRWRSWWSGAFVATAVFTEMRGRFVELPAFELPEAIIAKMHGGTSSRLELLARSLAPLTTNSLADGARFLRALV